MRAARTTSSCPDGHRRVDGTVRSGDPVIHTNFRADRARQLTHALADLEFDEFDRAASNGTPVPDRPFVVTMTDYEAGLPVQVAFPPEASRSLAQAFSEAGWRQFHVAETEKYAHVTYFFNGGVEPPYPGEDRRLIPSLRVATYDLAPEMPAAASTDALVAGIASGEYDFIVANYANADMVGHTGNWAATQVALEALDGCLARIVDAIEAVDAADPDGARCAARDHRRPRQRRCAARPRREPGHRAFPQSGAARPRREAGHAASGSPTASSPTWRRPCSSLRAWGAGPA